MRYEPYHQGSLDTLCGLYALVNGVEWAFRETNPFSPTEAKGLMRHMIADLDERGKLAATMTHGLTIPAFGRVINIAGDWLSDHRAIDLVKEKPFHLERQVSADRMKGLLSEHLAAVAQSAIVLIEGKIKHWTVVTRVSRTGVQLADSEGRQRLRNIFCAPPMESEDRKARIRIVPQGIYLLTFHSL